MRTLVTLLMVVALMLVTASGALARRHDPPPPPAPVEVDAICQERISPGAGRWKPAGECNRDYQVIVFDGVTEYDFCFVWGSGSLIDGFDGCPSNSTPITLTGDGSVDLFIGDHDVLNDVAGTPAVI